MISTYLNDQMLQCLLVLGSFGVVAALEFVDGKDFEVFKTLIALDHLLNAHLGVLLGDSFLVIDERVTPHLIVLLLSLPLILNVVLF